MTIMSFPRVERVSGSIRDGSCVKRQPNLAQVMLVMRGDLVKFVFQRPHPRDTVHELEMPLLLVVPAGVVDDGGANRFVYPPRDVERHLRIVEALGPGILIIYPEHLTRLAENSADAIEQNRLAIGEVVEDKSDGPSDCSVSA